MARRITVAGLFPGASPEEVAHKAFALLKQIRTVALATINGDRPAVRFMHISAIQDGKLYFLTPRGKPVYHQIKNTPTIAISGMTPDHIVVRVEGSVTFMKDRTFLERLIANKEGMYAGKTDILEMFVMEGGTGEIFDLSSDLPGRMPFSFGKPGLLNADTGSPIPVSPVERASMPAPVMPSVKERSIGFMRSGVFIVEDATKNVRREQLSPSISPLAPDTTSSSHLFNNVSSPDPGDEQVPDDLLFSSIQRKTISMSHSAENRFHLPLRVFSEAEQKTTYQIVQQMHQVREKRDVDYCGVNTNTLS